MPSETTTTGAPIPCPDCQRQTYAGDIHTCTVPVSAAPRREPTPEVLAEEARCEACGQGVASPTTGRIAGACMFCGGRMVATKGAWSMTPWKAESPVPSGTTQREEWVVITELGGNCPVQAEGTIDGQPFYFRARGETISIEIGPGNTALVVAAMEQARRDPEAWESEAVARETVGARGCWRYEEHNHDWPAAGWISEEFARAWIALAAVRYRERRPTSTLIEGASE